MDLFAVMAEVATALKTLPGPGGTETLAGRVFDWQVGKINSPGVIVGLPDSIDFDQTYGRGQDKFSDLVVMLLLGKGDQRSAQKFMGPYVAGAGASSVKAKLDGYAWTTCHRAVVNRVEFLDVEYAAVPYLAASFHTDIWGSGG